MSFMNQYLNRPSNVKELQMFYQAGPLPVHLKGKAGISTYRGVMFLCAAGGVYAGYMLTNMAMGKLKRQ